MENTCFLHTEPHQNQQTQSNGFAQQLRHPVTKRSEHAKAEHQYDAKNGAILSHVRDASVFASKGEALISGVGQGLDFRVIRADAGGQAVIELKPAKLFLVRDMQGWAECFGFFQRRHIEVHHIRHHRGPEGYRRAAMGANIRVGLEDSIWISRGKLAETNAQQVTKARTIIEGLGREIATPDEAREMLGLKGGDRVNF